MNVKPYLLFTCIVSLLIPSAVAQERRYSLLEREVEYLMELWPGDYDNREQLQFDANVGKATVEQGGHRRVHSQIRRVELPAFGNHVLYGEDYMNNDPGQVYRQRVYEFIADETEGAVRVRQHVLKDPSSYRGAFDDPSMIAGLTRADTITDRACDLLLRRDVDALSGGTQGSACVQPGASDDGADFQVRITDTQLWIQDALLAGQESPTALSWYQLERARWFQCMVDFPREDGGRPVNTVDYVRIHDQGGSYPFTYRDGREMVLTLRNNWSYGMQRETLVVVVQETDEDGPTLVYGWSEPGADRIGVNPGWIRLQCDLDTAKMRRFQQWLRPDS